MSPTRRTLLKASAGGVTLALTGVTAEAQAGPRRYDGISTFFDPVSRTSFGNNETIDLSDHAVICTIYPFGDEDARQIVESRDPAVVRFMAALMIARKVPERRHIRLDEQAKERAQ